MPIGASGSSSTTSTGRVVWLVDATTYRPMLPPDLQATKATFFRMESIARQRHGAAPVRRGMRTLSVGLLRIATILRSWGYTPAYLTLDEAAVALEDVAPGAIPPVLGFGAVCPTVPACAALAEVAHARSPGTRCVLGGAHAAVASRLTAKRYPVFDDIVSTSDVAAAAQLVAEAETRPAPVGFDHSILPYSVGDYAWNLRTASGCPFSCSYCQDRSAQRTTEELDGGLHRLAPFLEPETHIHYSDSVLGGTVRRALTVCDAIERLNHGMRLSCDLRPELLRPELLSGLVRAGFREIRVGLDSADENVLRDNDRTARARALPEVLTRVKSFSPELYVSVYLVTGLPGSTAATLPKNLALIDDLLTEGLADQIKHHLYVPYPFDEFPTSHPDVRITQPDWASYDRNSFPCYELPAADSETVWEWFLETERFINDSWQRRLRLSAEEVAAVPMHCDYNAQLYANGREGGSLTLRGR